MLALSICPGDLVQMLCINTDHSVTDTVSISVACVSDTVTHVTLNTSEEHLTFEQNTKSMLETVNCAFILVESDRC
jgi:predicted transcriptional regulator YheO